MKRIITILLIFSALQSEGQTYTTSKLSQYMRAQWATNDSVRSKQVVKDANDDVRNLKIAYLSQRDSLLFWQNEQLNQRATRLEKKLDSAGWYVNGSQFVIDTTTKTLSIKPDTVIVKIGSSIVPSASMVYPLYPLSDPSTTVISSLKTQVKNIEKIVSDRDKEIKALKKTIVKQDATISKLKKTVR